MPRTPYPQLRAHSYYTLLGAIASPEELAARAAAEGVPSLALADVNALYGAVTFDRACRAAGVSPVIGMTVSVAWPEALGASPEASGSPGQLVLLVRNPAGYRSLCRLTHRLKGDARRETLTSAGLSLADLRTASDGIICVTGGRLGFLYRCLQTPSAPSDRAVHRYLGRLSGIYGPENTYVALELHTTRDRAAAEHLTEKARFLGLQTVAVSPVYALTSGDRERLTLLAAIDRNCRVADVPADALPDRGNLEVTLHWLSPDQLRQRYAPFPQALETTHEIAQRCGDGVLPHGSLRWPTLSLPDGLDPAAALRHEALAGTERRYSPPVSGEVSARLEREIAQVSLQGYAPLFLVVADIVRYARQRGIPVSTRGSVANSLVAYALGITTVDPIEHDLLFERFLSPGRADPPDIDLDFCSRRREEVQNYVRLTYGEDRVALVGAMSTLQLRSAGRETAKAIGLDESRTKRLLAQLPRHYHPSQKRKSKEEVLAEISDPAIRSVARAAYGIAGFPHHLSIHAGGLVITPGPLTDLVPVQMSPKGFLTTQYSHGDCEAVGLPKLDLLGIRALTVLADAVAAAAEVRPGFSLDTVPLDDPATADALARGDTIGVFQCDSVGARRTLRKLRVRTVKDLAVANAFFKPGPATGGQADAFVSRYRGETQTRYQHPALEPILERTKGVLIFQEQVLRVATEVAGLSWSEADHIRRGMSKMKPDEMRDLAGAFIAGCQRPDGPGLSREQARSLWEQVSAFSGYGFNQGHATAYADVSYRSTYMKVHFPAAFFWARIRNYGGYHHPAVYIAEATRLGIAVRLPDINHSVAHVALDRTDNAHPVLWLGLDLVRDLRRTTVDRIVRARERSPFTDLRDLLVRVSLQPRETTHLIKSGAADGLGVNRQAMLQQATTLGRAGDARQLAFDFAAGYAAPATASQRLIWEKRLVGYPLQSLREVLGALQILFPDAIGVSDLRKRHGPATVAGVRIPGWHRGGFALWDGADWCWARCDDSLKWPPDWEPTVFQGHWQRDRWGMGSMMVRACEAGTL